jgi:hypothetical protein
MILELLQKNYNFFLLFQEIYREIGPTNLIILFGAFLVIASYGYHSWWKGLQLGEDLISSKYIVFIRIYSLFFIIPSLFILLFIWDLWSIFIMLLYSFPVLLLLKVNNLLMKIANYELILKINSMKTSPLSILLKREPRPYYKVLILLMIYWILMIVEFYFTLILNPTFKLIVWIYLFVFFPVAIISGFVFEGAFNSIQRLKFVKIKTNYCEIISGFLTGKGNDHVMVLTEKGEIFLPITNIEKIIFSQDHNKIVCTLEEVNSTL